MLRRHGLDGKMAEIAQIFARQPATEWESNAREGTQENRVPYRHKGSISWKKHEPQPNITPSHIFPNAIQLHRIEKKANIFIPNQQQRISIPSFN